MQLSKPRRSGRRRLFIVLLVVLGVLAGGLLHTAWPFLTYPRETLSFQAPEPLPADASGQPLAGIPELGIDTVGHLTPPIKELSMTEDRADLVLGDESYGARLTLSRIGDRFVIEDATFVAGPGLDQHVELRRAGRLNLAAGP